MVTAYTDGFPPRLNVAEHGDETRARAVLAFFLRCQGPST